MWPGVVKIVSLINLDRKKVVTTMILGRSNDDNEDNSDNLNDDNGED